VLLQHKVAKTASVEAEKQAAAEAVLLKEQLARLDSAAISHEHDRFEHMPFEAHLRSDDSARSPALPRFPRAASKSVAAQAICRRASENEAVSAISMSLPQITGDTIAPRTATSL